MHHWVFEYWGDTVKENSPWLGFNPVQWSRAVAASASAVWLYCFLMSSAINEQHAEHQGNTSHVFSLFLSNKTCFNDVLMCLCSVPKNTFPFMAPVFSWSGSQSEPWIVEQTVKINRRSHKFFHLKSVSRLQSKNKSYQNSSNSHHMPLNILCFF